MSGGGGPRDNGGQQASLDRPWGGCTQRPRHSAEGGHRGLRLVIGRGRTAGSLRCGQCYVLGIFQQEDLTLQGLTPGRHSQGASRAQRRVSLGVERCRPGLQQTEGSRRSGRGPPVQRERQELRLDLGQPWGLQGTNKRTGQASRNISCCRSKSNRAGETPGDGPAPPKPQRRNGA